MSTLTYCAKQASAMAEFSTERAKSKMDAAIDAEETRDELIAARAQELIVKRTAEMAQIDVVCGMQSVLEGGAARLIAERLLVDDLRTVGLYVRALVHEYIKTDSEVMAHEWMERMDKEVAMWGVQ
ncbi:hypothetical protein [Paraburkholderia sediminicola]|uniref:hypothetical protein n=1 Tax=Paraburkholderia sediminicola TaxID=458836 RepID=UPI0038BD80B1